MQNQQKSNAKKKIKLKSKVFELFWIFIIPKQLTKNQTVKAAVIMSKKVTCFFLLDLMKRF